MAKRRPWKGPHRLCSYEGCKGYGRDPVCITCGRCSKHCGRRGHEFATSAAPEPIVSGPPLVESLSELEEFVESLEATVQITCRSRLTPRYLVRIQRKGIEKGATIFRQATGRTIAEAFERCLEAWSMDVEAENSGRRSTTEVID